MRLPRSLPWHAVIQRARHARPLLLAVRTTEQRSHKVAQLDDIPFLDPSSDGCMFRTRARGTLSASHPASTAVEDVPS